MAQRIMTNNFILYGLNRYRNFLHPSVDEDGDVEYLDLPYEDDVKEFCTAILHKHPCPDTAMFCVFNDGAMSAVVKIWDDDDHVEYDYLVARDMHFFAQIDAELTLCCYALICEITPGCWKIME